MLGFEWKISRRSALVCGSIALGCTGKRVARDRSTPIVLVHGMFADHTAMEPLRAFLQRSGFTRVFAPDLRPVDGTLSIVQLAEQLDAHVQGILRQTRSRKIDLVGYSLGAMVTRYWLLRQNGASVTRRFVSLAGPHHGVVGGLLSTAVVAEELRPLSPFLTALQTPHTDWKGVEVASFLSPFDAVIVPTETAVAPRSKIVHVFLAPSHHHMATDHHVLRAVEGVLSSSPMTLPADLPTPRELSTEVRSAIAQHRLPEL